MTVEELDIIVSASIQPALEEFRKLLPAIRKRVQEISNQFNNIDLNGITANIDTKLIENKAKEAKKKIKDIFNSDDTSMKINGEDIKKEINGISNSFSKLTGKKDDLSNIYNFTQYKQKNILSSAVNSNLL